MEVMTASTMKSDARAFSTAGHEAPIITVPTTLLTIVQPSVSAYSVR